MINAKELRIGNFISDIHSKKGFWQVKQLHEKTCYYGDFSENYNNLVGIPITEQWLLDLGFESNPYQDRYEKGFINIECNKLRGETELWIDGLPHIKYVHQLQNLYYALTGQELELNKK